MGRAIQVSDSLSNTEEQIERAAKTIGRSELRSRVFEAIYFGKARVKSVGEISEQTNLNRKQVLNEGRRLVVAQIVHAAKKKGDTAYEKIDFFQAHKKKILKYAKHPKELDDLPTKRRKTIQLEIRLDYEHNHGALGRAASITIDDLDSFEKVKKIEPAGYISDDVSEEQFKHGVQRILGEKGEWKDWGGELFDLASTRVVVNGNRIGAVFAFKGPGTKGDLTPAKMGKNGDQIVRMFFADARLYVVQYCRRIMPTIGQMMRSMAVEKAAATGGEIYYCVIDGIDSRRLYSAYFDEFQPEQ